MEQGWDREATLDRLCLKAGLTWDEWRTVATFEVFETSLLHRVGGAREAGPST